LIPFSVLTDVQVSRVDGEAAAIGIGRLPVNEIDPGARQRDDAR
jgi:hypothetical protein